MDCSVASLTRHGAQRRRAWRWCDRDDHAHPGRGWVQCGHDVEWATVECDAYSDDVRDVTDRREGLIEYEIYACFWTSI